MEVNIGLVLQDSAVFAWLVAFGAVGLFLRDVCGVFGATGGFRFQPFIGLASEGPPSHDDILAPSAFPVPMREAQTL